MTKSPKLTPRLLSVAEFARAGKRIADIGTDHALLPTYLTLEGISPAALACDIKEGPLQKALETIERYNAVDKVKTLLSDGLSDVDKTMIDDIIIAGMGGETIISIIAGKEWLHEGDRRLILQPMTAIPELRLFLYQNGFQIEKETVAKEGSKLYVIMCVKSGKVEVPDTARIEYGSFDADENAKLYLNFIITKHEKNLKGLKISSKPEDEIKLQQTQDILNALSKKRRELFGKSFRTL